MATKAAKAAAPQDEHQALLATLQQRFEQHPQRHPTTTWAQVQARLTDQPQALRTLAAMEATGGEPDVVELAGQGDQTKGAIAFCDCAPESPTGRRSLCYDDAGLQSRKENRPAGSAVEMAAAMGLRLLCEAEYLALQTLGPFDQKTSSWLLTPEALRREGGALFGDYRYGRGFVYHNGAQSYYAARGFRGLLVV
ncbi:DUF4256 domain-containing protein [Aquincola tertiaricarbonis]|uniref:DUF4256 domain-containing protein n=1 Tax=Aquincola tertiaricarbonis TaxID=391953 RepID=A0ABY4S5R3_AQUTE|nr:DUF4256 domain-containing protein [Aquincola tertiaricarbonis]URI07053.1 DUF4256 domain-containing protein [Aquincola tertiaricarbonis]